jgi:hypothetical protein
MRAPRIFITISLFVISFFTGKYLKTCNCTMNSSVLKNRAVVQTTSQALTTAVTTKKTSSTRCSVIFLYGGGKAGSTTIASLLKHREDTNYQEYDESTSFDDGGKEICWEKNRGPIEKYFKTGCTPPNNFALDACPKHPTESRLNDMVERGVLFIMPVRNPITRLISWFNDKASSGQTYSKNIDKWIWDNRVKPDLRYAENLRRILRKGVKIDNIVIISEYDLSNINRLKGIMHGVENKLCLRPHKYRMVMTNHRSAGGSRYLKGIPSDDVVNRLNKYFEKFNEDFFNLTGRDYGWNQHPS